MLRIQLKVSIARLQYPMLLIILLHFLECTDIRVKIAEMQSLLDDLCAIPTSTWTSVKPALIGASNLRYASTLSFTIPKVIPSTAKEVLVNAGIRIGHSNIGPNVNIKIFTQIGSTRYEKYLLVYSWPQEAYNTNSDNMWFPMSTDRKLLVTVPAAFGKNAGIQLDAIGYR